MITIQFSSCSEEYLEIDGQRFCDNQLARLAFTSTSSKSILIKYVTKGLNTTSSRYMYRGFNVYFESYNLMEVTTTRQPETTTYFANKEIRDRGQTGQLTLLTFLVGISTLVALVGAVLVINKYFGARNDLNMKINYSNERSKTSYASSMSNPLD